MDDNTALVLIALVNVAGAVFTAWLTRRYVRRKPKGPSSAFPKRDNNK